MDQHIDYKNQRFTLMESVLMKSSKKIKLLLLIFKNVLSNNYLKFKQAASQNGIEQSKVCFAMKSNSNLKLLKQLKKLGAGCDIVSGGELALALKAGFKGRDIVFSGVGKHLKKLKRHSKLIFTHLMLSLLKS